MIKIGTPSANSTLQHIKSNIRWHRPTQAGGWTCGFCPHAPYLHDPLTLTPSESRCSGPQHHYNHLKKCWSRRSLQYSSASSVRNRRESCVQDHRSQMEPAWMRGRYKVEAWLVRGQRRQDMKPKITGKPDRKKHTRPNKRIPIEQV